MPPRTSARPRPAKQRGTEPTRRAFPRFSLHTVTRGEFGYAAFLIDNDTGDTWLLDVDLSWKKIARTARRARPKAKR